MRVNRVQEEGVDERDIKKLTAKNTWHIRKPGSQKRGVGAKFNNNKAVVPGGRRTTVSTTKLMFSKLRTKTLETNKKFTIMMLNQLFLSHSHLEVN